MLTTLLLSCLALQGQATDTLTLRAATLFAREHRASLVAASAAVDEARGDLAARRRPPNPTANYTRSDDAPRSTFTIQQSFDWLLSRGGSVGAGHAGVARAEAQLEGSTRDLTRQVHVAFISALAARRVRELAAAQLAVADTLVRFAERRLAAGDIAEAEFERLRLERILAEQTLSRVRAEESRARLALGRTLGWPTDSALPPLGGDLTEGLDCPLPVAPSTAELPMVRSAFADSTAFAAEARSTNWARIPLPTVEVGRQWDNPSAPGANLWLVGASIPIPIWTQGGGPAMAARARARISAASLSETKLAAEQALATAGVQLEEARHRARLASDSLLPGAGQLRVRAARAYALGQTGVLPLLEAFRVEREIVVSAMTDLVAYQEALAEWNALTGNTE